MTETGVYFGAFGLLLSKYSGENKFLTSIILSNRGHHEIANTVGMFVNTIPYSFNIDSSTSWKEYAKAVGKNLADIYQYQELPLLEICNAAGIKTNSVNTAFIYQPGELTAENLEITSYDTKTCKLDLSFQVIPQKSGDVRTVVEFNGAKYDEKLIIALENSYAYILEQIDAEKILDTFSIVPEDEYRKVVYEFNDTYSDYPRSKCVHELFAEQVKKTPDKTALIFEDTEFTYSQLDEMSNALAHHLRERGVKPNDIIPIISKRSWHVIVAMLGILKAGGAYMPVDPMYPKDRIGYMLSEAKSSVALTFGYSESLDISTVDLETFDFYCNPEPIENVSSPEDTCYVIFTSGSTGKPKGTLVKHKGLNNFSNKNNVFYNAIFKDCSKVISIGSLTFDISICEIIQPLVSGASVILASESDINNTDEIARLISDKCVDLICITPSRLLYYLQNVHFKKSIARIKTILSAGEAFSPKAFEEISKYANAKIFNSYGPSETTCGVTYSIVNNSSITIGKPISNTQIYILNSQGKVCPIGVPGELCISGDGVGKGYLNRPELTAEKFVPNPFIAGKTMYKSGDLARWRTDGELEYLGRIDTQVKIRGLRIELGEIESVMAAFEGINMTAAADKKDASGRQYLVGYYTSEKEIDEKQLREFLSSKLPRYMIPNYFMRLDEIPMTSSGKTDRKNLPQPEITELATEFVAPVTATEKILCDAISKLFDGRKTGTSDNFFELGGDSLSAMQLVALLSEKGIIINMQDIYEYPTSAELGAFIDGKTEIHSEYKPEDFEKYNSILKPNSLNAAHELRYKPLGNILITGSTGFLGAHLLNEAFIKESGKIYCLVRNEERLKKTLQYYFGQKYSLEVGNRIIPIIGDITDVNPSSLPTNVDTVIHSAANVKHYGNYSDFEKTNIIGTKNMLDYACSGKAQFIFISTTSVGGMTLKRQGSFTVFSESDIYIGQNLDNVYIRSKFEAERLVLDRIQGGLIGQIFRMGNLTNRYSDGVFQPNYTDNAFLKRIKSFIDVRAIPNDLSKEYAEMTPVDKAAEAVILLAKYADNTQTVFHISNSSNAVTYEKLTELLCKAGINLTFIPTARFIDRIDAAPNGESGFIMNELNELQRQSSEAKVTADSSYTSSVLSEIGFKWPDISEEYLKKYIEYFRSLNYFE